MRCSCISDSPSFEAVIRYCPGGRPIWMYSPFLFDSHLELPAHAVGRLDDDLSLFDRLVFRVDNLALHLPGLGIGGSAGDGEAQEQDTSQ